MDPVVEWSASEKHQLGINIECPIILHNKARAKVDSTVSKIHGAISVAAVESVVQIDPAVFVELWVHCHSAKAVRMKKETAFGTARLTIFFTFAPSEIIAHQKCAVQAFSVAVR